MKHYCVIGSGAVGVTLCLELAKLGNKVTLVTGGKRKETDKLVDTYKSDGGNYNHESLNQSRCRAYGGSTLRWGGRCIPYDAVDFRPNKQMGLDDLWPFDIEEFDENLLLKASDYCELGSTQFSYPPDTLKPSDTLQCDRVERWSPPTNFATEYDSILARHANIETLVDWHLVDLNIENGKIQVASLQSTEGDKKDLVADDFILCCGGIETTRIMLNLTERNADLKDAMSESLGHYYQGHLSGSHGVLKLTKKAAEDFDFFRENKSYIRRRFWVNEDTQRELSMLNVIGFPFRPKRNELNDMSIALLDTLEKKKIDKSLFKVFFKSSFKSKIHAVKQLTKRFTGKYRIPFILPHDTTVGSLTFQSEHFPYFDSRLELSEEEDFLGWKRIRPYPTFGEREKDTVVKFFRLVKEYLENGKHGELIYDEDELKAQLKLHYDHYYSGYHHIGTTRISTSPTEGVVNENLKCHNLENLHICSSSVFPTSGHANPTFLAVCLAIRLADHLKK